MKIEKSIPIPKRHSPGRTPKYPFAQMDIGDSILVDGESAHPKECKAYNASLKHGQKYGKKFSGRKEPGQPGKVRIWRVA